MRHAHHITTETFILILILIVILIIRRLMRGNYFMQNMNTIWRLWTETRVKIYERNQKDLFRNVIIIVLVLFYLVNFRLVSLLNMLSQGVVSRQ